MQSSWISHLLSDLHVRRRINTLKCEKSQLIDAKTNYFGYIEQHKIDYLENEHSEIINNLPSGQGIFFYFDTILLDEGNCFPVTCIVFIKNNEYTRYTFDRTDDHIEMLSFENPEEMIFYTSYESALNRIFSQHCSEGCERIASTECQCLPLIPVPWFDVRSPKCRNPMFW